MLDKLKYYLIKIFYFLKLRSFSISLQRLIAGELNAKKSSLVEFNTPEDIQKYIFSKFQYRLDYLKILNKKIPLDWVSSPEVFQARLEDTEVLDGDCDDYHYWVATCLSKIRDVKKVYLLSVVWTGGGHTVCVYFYQGNWWLFNYTISRVDSPNDVPYAVLRRHAPGSKIIFYVFEDLKFNAIAISPKTAPEVVYDE